MHIGIIMDGNRRWAKQHALAAIMGHESGVKNLEQILQACEEAGVETLTLYALSTENFVKRTGEEINHLLELLYHTAIDYKERLLGRNVRVRILGKIHTLPEHIRLALEEISRSTEDCTGKVLQICINYGGRDEIIRAVQKVLDKDQIVTEESVTENLDSSLEPHLIIRTGGNQRLSNFLTWQSAYSELYFTDKLWPDFTAQDLKTAIDFYHTQQRNFGK